MENDDVNRYNLAFWLTSGARRWHINNKYFCDACSSSNEEKAKMKNDGERIQVLVDMIKTNREKYRDAAQNLVESRKMIEEKLFEFIDDEMVRFRDAE